MAYFRVVSLALVLEEGGSLYTSYSHLRHKYYLNVSGMFWHSLAISATSASDGLGSPISTRREVSTE